MNSISFTKAELTAAIARGVRQCVLIGSRQPLCEAFKNPPKDLHVFAVDEEEPRDLPATFVPTQFESEALAAALKKSDFDKLKATLFVWLGGAGYRTFDAIIASLAFIASLPRGSGVLFDYAVERTCSGPQTDTALDALASRISLPDGSVKHFVQPEGVTAMLRSLGLQKLVDLAAEFSEGGHLVSAVV